MRKYLRSALTGVVAVGSVVALAACGSSSTPSPGASGTGTHAANTGAVKNGGTVTIVSGTAPLSADQGLDFTTQGDELYSVINTPLMVFKRGGTAFGFIATAFSLLGGVYYPTSVLSPPLRLVADILPFTWVLDVIRAGLLERRMLWGEFALMIGVAVALIPIALSVFSWSVARARRSGTLGQY